MGNGYEYLAYHDTPKLEYHEVRYKHDIIVTMNYLKLTQPLRHFSQQF